MIDAAITPAGRNLLSLARVSRCPSPIQDQFFVNGQPSVTHTHTQWLTTACGALGGGPRRRSSEDDRQGLQDKDSPAAGTFGTHRESSEMDWRAAAKYLSLADTPSRGQRRAWEENYDHDGQGELSQFKRGRRTMSTAQLVSVAAAAAAAASQPR